jgi:hypothetical protein
MEYMTVQATMLAKRGMFTHLNCLVLTELASKSVMAEHIFLLKDIMIFFKILASNFI